MTIVRAGTLIEGTGAAPARDVSLILHGGRRTSGSGSALFETIISRAFAGRSRRA
jgi:hypothetical protein